ncbi:MAG: hypothetical protein P8X57_01965, partial [Cyclobacteriaceae bacterium]
GEGRSFNEKSVLLVEEGTYAGFGFYQADEPDMNESVIRDIIRPGTSSSEIEQYIQSFVHHPDLEFIPLGSSGPA